MDDGRKIKEQVEDVNPFLDLQKNDIEDNKSVCEIVVWDVRELEVDVSRRACASSSVTTREGSCPMTS